MIKPIKKIGLLGGTFDPIHRGHTSIAKKLIEQCQLDDIQFIPNYHPATNKVLNTSPQHRLKMVKLATKSHPHFHPNDLEIQRQGASYTIDTLQALRQANPLDSLAFIVGEDAFNSIDQWNDYEQFMSLCHIIVVNRLNNHTTPSKCIARLLTQHRSLTHDVLHQHTHGSIFYFSTHPINISSTHIRNHLLEDKTKNSLDPTVYQYIIDNNLYSKS